MERAGGRLRFGWAPRRRTDFGLPFGRDGSARLVQEAHAVVPVPPQPEPERVAQGVGAGELVREARDPREVGGEPSRRAEVRPWQLVDPPDLLDHLEPLGLPHQLLLLRLRVPMRRRVRALHCGVGAAQVAALLEECDHHSRDETVGGHEALPRIPLQGGAAPRVVHPHAWRHACVPIVNVRHRQPSTLGIENLGIEVAVLPRERDERREPVRAPTRTQSPVRESVTGRCARREAHGAVRARARREVRHGWFHGERSRRRHSSRPTVPKVLDERTWNPGFVTAWRRALLSTAVPPVITTI